MVLGGSLALMVYKRHEKNIAKASHVSLTKFREDMLNQPRSSQATKSKEQPTIFPKTKFLGLVALARSSKVF